MTEEVFEIRIVKVGNMSEPVRRIVNNKVIEKGTDFKKEFKGFAKITYVTASPPRIKDIEPIKGTIAEFYGGFSQDVDPNVF